MGKTYDKICKYCGDPFTADRVNKEYCSPTHAKYESLAREGKKERPVRLKVEIENKELNEEQKADVRAEIDSLNPEIDKLYKEIQQTVNAELDKEGWTIEELRNSEDLIMFAYPDDLLSNLILKRFRILEKRNDLIKSLLDVKTLVGSEIIEFHKSKTVYPFSQYETCDLLFKCIGDLPQPFRSVIYGEHKSGKSLLAVKIANHLIRKLDATVLFAVDEEQVDYVLNYINLFEIKSDRFVLRNTSSFNEIVEVLTGSSVEFLFLDSMSSYSITKQVLMNLKRRFPKVSIFCTSEKTNLSFENVFNTIFRIRTCEQKEISRGAHAAIYNNGKVAEDTVHIFLDQMWNNSFSYKYF